MCQVSADFRRGVELANILLVGACPGREEEQNGRPFVGTAGQYLRSMFRTLNLHWPCFFPSADPDEYSMLNANPLPRYRARAGFGGLTQPTKTEVMAAENRVRVRSLLILVNPERVLYLGNAAEFIDPIVNEVLPDTQVFRTGHPSPTAWNTKANYRGMTREEKLERWTRDQFRQRR
jgi:uracil-DNA glycosylase